MKKRKYGIVAVGYIWKRREIDFKTFFITRVLKNLFFFHSFIHSVWHICLFSPSANWSYFLLFWDAIFNDFGASLMS